MKMIISHILFLLLEIFIYIYLIDIISIKKLGYPYYFIFRDDILFRSSIVVCIMNLIMVLLLSLLNLIIDPHTDIIIIAHLSNLFGCIFSGMIMYTWLNN